MRRAFEDPYREFWLAMRNQTIQFIRTARVIRAAAPPEAAAFHRDLEAALCGVITAVEQWTEVKTPWAGA